ncbi:MAG TPA: hypothetical protein VKS79_09845 [Gemmataceae bacterium]|nr:hypothetical protein [Gemmataceae bacterium]
MIDSPQLGAPMKHVELLRKWARLAPQRSSPLKGGRPNWDALSRLIEAAKEKLKFEEDRLRYLLNESNRMLAPLLDPLTTDLGTHRWLSEDREESYSDWLAWITGQIQRPESVFALLGLESPPNVDSWPDQAPAVSREVWVREGNEGQTGRLDLVMRYPGKVFIVVELKKVKLQEAETKKHEGYLLTARPGVGERSYYVILTADEQAPHASLAQNTQHSKFKCVTWTHVCIELRRISTAICNQGNFMVAAMMLAFAGAVEQNLLGLSAASVKDVLNGRRGVLRDIRIIDHLEHWVMRGE